MNASRRRSHEISEIVDSTVSLRIERDALQTRVLILEATLACITRESEVPQRHPELAFMAVQRIGSVARQALERDRAQDRDRDREREAPPVSGLLPIARTRGTR